jgi:hypothetical protein
VRAAACSWPLKRGVRACSMGHVTCSDSSDRRFPENGRGLDG